MEKLLRLYMEFFRLQNYRHDILEDKKNWPAGMDYTEMCNQANQLRMQIASIREEIEVIEEIINPKLK